ncbi:tetratricopeptide repeat protein [Flavobacterium sp. D11R37]|uniref:tetratricopeptide repeat protein n=1 Tax=Flavobacterium coralii TaxID=2838017 RepID=UPI001CA6E70D|nr:tetratricopeptide repeat protein [Flavobacterium coralii]MBY8963768.1 tetratricopeptide repeat protein [Flavobacterium coralii]
MIKTKDLKFLGLSLLLFGAANAQSADEAKKAIDAEKFQKAKTILKNLIASEPEEGKNYFLLGDVYLKQKEQDSAAIYFNKGKAVKKDPEYNTIGLGHIDLNKGNTAAAQSKFKAVEDGLRRKDSEQLVYIGRAYVNAENPDYNKAIEVLKRAIAKDDKNAQAYITLGDAYVGAAKYNEAFQAYRDAVALDNTAQRASLQMAVITKNTRAAFPEAVSAFENILKKDPNYGPAYRELAETYYLWANTDTAKYDQYMKKALENYEKYMQLTDYSLNSRMRHADFLVLARDYKALEAEAKKMQELDKVNPRILRYLAYSAYENGNFKASLDAMNEFMAKVEKARLIARDYLYLGLAKMASTVNTDAEGNTTITDQAKFDQAIKDIQKAAELDIDITNEFNAIGKKLFAQKLYGPASYVFETAISNPDNRNAFYDNFYLAYSIYYDHLNMTEEAKKNNTERLKLASTALDNVIKLSPEAPDAFLYKARINQAIGSEESYATMSEAYDKYIEIVAAKAQRTDAEKKNLIEAYSNAGAYYAITNKAKGKEYFNKVLELDPNDAFAKQELQKLKN